MLIPTLAVRGLQLIFGAVVLGLSITLIKHQRIGRSPAESGYAAFCGAWAMLLSLIGVAAAFVTAIPVFVTMAADGLSALLLLAGGIALTVAMKGVSCTSDRDNEYGIATELVNKILNGGSRDCPDNKICYGVLGDVNSNDARDAAGDLKDRCMKAQADYVFLYLGFVAFLVTIVLTFFLRKRGSGGRMVL